MRIKFLAMASLAALAVGTLATGPAFAADPAPGAQPAASVPANLIDTAHATSLTIHKYSGNPTGPGNGQPVTINTTTNPPLSGIAFDVYKVNGVDLTTNDGWSAANVLYQHPITQEEITAKQLTVNQTTYQLSKKNTVTTGQNGEATFTGEVGLYLVVENLTTSTNAEKGQISPSAPFLVTLPMTNATSKTAWDYDVDVYPKNQKDTVTKKVLDGNVGTENQDAFKVGQKLTYQLTGSITAADYNGDGAISGTDIGFFAFSDQLVTNLSDPQVTTVEVVDKEGQPLNPAVTLTADTDYTVNLTSTPDPNTAPDALPNTAGGTTVNVSLTKAGLDKIATHDGDNVRATVTATVKTMPTNGSLDNKASFIPNNRWITGRGNPPKNPGENPPPGVPTDKVTSKFGDIVIKKVDAADSSKSLAGAEFSIYRDTNFDGTCSTGEVTGTPIATAAATNDQGLTKFAGLQLSNFYNNATQTTMHGYCIVETKAPEGFELLAEPMYFTLTAEGQVSDLSAAYADKQRDDSPTDTTGANLQVGDVPSNIGNRLPLTGGAGAGLIGFAGLAIVAGAGGGLMIKRRRTQQR